MAAPLNVFSIPAGAPFLSVLAEAILDGRLGPITDIAEDPLGLARVTVLLPTRRAVRAFRETLIGKLGGDAAILPTIRPIGDADEEDHLLDFGVEPEAERLALPPAIGRLPRQLALTELTLAWGRNLRRQLLEIAADEPLHIPASAADATRLAADLARLIDDMETAGIPWDRVRDLAPDDHAAFFQITLDFLKIAFEAWPALLAERGAVDPVVRRDSLILAEAERLRRRPPAGPVIAAGSTGTIPATAELLKAIAGLPQGALVLPGLDHYLDDDAWAAVGETGVASVGHPQFGLKQLLARLGISRADVRPLGAVPPPLIYRARLAAEALRPAETTDAWSGLRTGWLDQPALEAALEDVTYLLAHNEREEALAIAIAIREAVETPGTTVALVTPDRPLARRVSAELGRWGLAVDDSAGTRLDLRPEGVFARLLAEGLAEPSDPAKLLALLKHRFAAFGMDPRDCHKAARILELAVFRGRRGQSGIAGLPAALAAAEAETKAEGARHVPPARRRLAPYEWALAARLATSIEAILGPVEALFRAQPTIAAGEAARHLLEALTAAASNHEKRVVGLFDGDGGEALLKLLTGLMEETRLSIAPAEFPAFLSALMADVAVAPSVGADPRIHIWGTLEARLQSADLLILGGLDEKIWPAATRTDPWLSRTMRTEIGLPPPERRIALAAHDFAQAFAASRVMLTRAERRAGAPTVASRWLQRLFALAGENAIAPVKKRGDVYVDLARDIDRPQGRPEPVPRPTPAPAIETRPRRLSVTEIETLIRDPYAIYAKHVLRLEPLDPIGLAPDYLLRGTLIHEALGKFTASWRGPFDAAAVTHLLALGRAALESVRDFPDIHAIWTNRFGAIAEWLIDWEARRNGSIAERHPEVPGNLALAAPAGTFTLSGRADRIDLRHDGRIEVLDFKTGTPPTAKQVLVGFAPQLGLEAAMARAGAFGESFAGRSIAALFWIGLSRVERGEPIANAVEDGQTADGVADLSHARLGELIAAYDDPARAYVSRARPMFEMRYESPYDHLARVNEWALVESEEDHPEWFGPPRP
ncbi:MAG TPA: double-strand break repair protein AddB [Bauldia sp.]|nr:double-strand break repair protein AddB [Bauldia sp.]